MNRGLRHDRLRWQARRHAGCGGFWRAINEHTMRSFFTAPTALRAIRRDDPKGLMVGLHAMENLQVIYSAGEHADPDTMRMGATAHKKVLV